MIRTGRGLVSPPAWTLVPLCGAKGRRLQPRRAILRRRHAERGAKSVLKVERSPKPLSSAIGEHRPARRGELERSATHSGAEEILMGRHAGQPAEDAQEVVLAHPRDRRQVLQLEPAAPRRIRPGGSLRRPVSPRAPVGAAPKRLPIGHRRDDALDEPNASSSRRSEDARADRASICATTGSAFGDGGRLGTEKRKRLVERHGRGDLAEQLLANIQRNAAIANAVRVTAFEAPAIVSEQQRAGIEQSVPGVRAIGEAPLDDGGDAEAVVPLLERPIGRSGAADDFVHAPAVAGRQRSLGGSLVRRLCRAPAPRDRTSPCIGGRIAIFPKPANRRPQ